MSTHHRVLFPVDLSKHSLTALKMATQLAKDNDASLCFVYVAPPLLPEEGMYGPEFRRRYVEEDKQEFEALRPTDDSVKHEHLFLQGNAGPLIVGLTKTADYCVMSTHGRGAILRLIMGSVAQYVLRNAKCPVVLVKGLEVVDSPEKELHSPAPTKHYVTEVMRQVAPVRGFDDMNDVLAQLLEANETGAPVVDDLGRCTGILTTTDIEQYRSLIERYEAKDKTVIPEMFETDKFGHIRCRNHDFDQVKRHMTADVISVEDSGTIQDALALFDANPEIHHLVVLDEDKHPVGMIDGTVVRQQVTGRKTQSQDQSVKES